MRTYEERTEVVKKKVLKNIKCGLCGRVNEIFNEGWEECLYSVDNVHIYSEFGHRIPGESFDIKKISFDICPDCFREKLIPWFGSQGVEPSFEEIDNYDNLTGRNYK